MGFNSNSKAPLLSNGHLLTAKNTFLDKATAVYLQNACLQHQYIRSRDVSAIFERPERLRAVTIGLCAAIARLEEAFSAPQEAHRKEVEVAEKEVEVHDPDNLAAAMARMNLVRDKDMRPPIPVSIVQSNARVDLLSHPAAKYIHGDIDGDIYLEKLKSWAAESWENIQKGGSEIPENLAQGDLYCESLFPRVLSSGSSCRIINATVCPESIVAIEGALGTVCEAVDKVVLSSRDPAESKGLMISRAFVAVRPPGHHCGEDTPCGFCFVNNVLVGAAHGMSILPYPTFRCVNESSFIPHSPPAAWHK